MMKGQLDQEKRHSNQYQYDNGRKIDRALDKQRIGVAMLFVIHRFMATGIIYAHNSSLPVMESA